MDTQYDLREGFFFNGLITDFEPMALRLNDSGGGAEYVQSMKVLGTQS